MRKRILAIAMALCLIITLLPATALAADAETITIGGVTLSGSADAPAYAATDENGAVSTEGASESSYNIKWDGSTLTLNGATITAGSSNGAAIYRRGELTITLTGSNTVKGPEAADSIGIRIANGNLTIGGGGSLDVSGRTDYLDIDATSLNIGIYVDGEYDITINNCTIEAEGSGVVSGSSYGIFSEFGDVIINGGTVTARGGAIQNSDSMSYGIRASEVSITNRGKVKAYGGGYVRTYAHGGSANWSPDSSYGICAPGGINITNSTVEAYGGTAKVNSVGIYTNSGDVTITGSSSVTASYNDEDFIIDDRFEFGDGYGIYSGVGVRVEGGMVYAYGAPATGDGSDSYGIYAKGNVAMSGFAMVTASGGDAPSGDSFGISAGANVEMSGNSTVNATGGTSGGGSFGIRAGSVTWSGYSDVTATGGTSAISAEGDVAMSGYGEVTATGDTATGGSYGISADSGDVSISNGTVKAESSDSGIYAGEGDVAISGGTVSATGGSYGIKTDAGQTIISGGESITASGGIQAINKCNISPVSGTTGDILGGDDAGSAVDVDADDGLSGHKYLNITFDVPASEIAVGGVYLRGSSAAIAYATTDAATGVVTLGGDEANHNIKWDGVTLTLKDATINGSISHNNNKVPSIRLVIEGVNSITGNISQEKYYNPSLTISGGGTLKISAGNTGINVYSLTIESGTLEITGGQSGVNAPGGVTIKGGEIEVNGGNAFTNDTEVTVDPQSGKQICVYVGDSEAEAWALGTYTSETELIVADTVNKYFHSYIEDAPIVTNVSVSPETATVKVGGTQQFTAAVSGTGDFSKDVNWSVSGNNSDDTTINDGVLKVAADETATELTVTATSVGDGTIYDTATVTVTQDEPEEYDIYIFGEGYDAPFYATTGDTPNTLTVCGEDDNWNIKWDGETLTLRNATVFCIMGNQAGTNTAIQRDAGERLAVQLTGDNTVVGPQYGIAAGNITISGDGTLRVWAHEIPRDGIVSYAFGGNVTITGGTVEAAGYHAPVSGSLTITPAEGGYELSAHDSFVADDDSPDWEAMAGAAEAVDFTAGSAVSLPEDTRYIKAAPAEDEPEPDPDWPDWPDWPWHPGGSGGTVTRYVMLTFETRGGSELDELRVPAGTTVDLSDYSSERAGYDFALWYPDESFSGSIDEIYMDRDKTVYAAWEPFADAAPGDWFYGDLVYVYENGLMDGVSETLFAPDGAVTRGMIVTILHRLEGGPV
ncbi:MAG TPA: InlB B-repeat-containing protein, partial [Candidatus Scatomorpha stercoravium]|nr:InlB B-repeat-containing protein [Candidatus Scatomorpha stercoravium]